MYVQINKGFDNLPSLFTESTSCTIPFTEMLYQAFAHCKRFFTAAAMRMGLVSVPLWPFSH